MRSDPDSSERRVGGRRLLRKVRARLTAGDLKEAAAWCDSGERLLLLLLVLHVPLRLLMRPLPTPLCGWRLLRPHRSLLSPLSLLCARCLLGLPQARRLLLLASPVPPLLLLQPATRCVCTLRRRRQTCLRHRC